MPPIDQATAQEIFNQIREVRDGQVRTETAVQFLAQKIDAVSATLADRARPCPDFKEHITEHKELMKQRGGVASNVISALIVALIVAAIGATIFALRNGWVPK